MAEIDLNNKTNRIPSEDELPRLRELVAKKSAIMDEIEAKINESTELQDDSLIKEVCVPC